MKTEQQRTIRRETIRVLGLLGAMDPYRMKLNKGLIDSQNDAILISMSDLKSDEHLDLSTAETLVNMGNVLEEYYPAIAISTLMRILRDPTLSQHHTSVVQAITFVFQSLGMFHFYPLQIQITQTCECQSKGKTYTPDTLPV